MRSIKHCGAREAFVRKKKSTTRLNSRGRGGVVGNCPQAANTNRNTRQGVCPTRMNPGQRDKSRIRLCLPQIVTKGLRNSITSSVGADCGVRQASSCHNCSIAGHVVAVGQRANPPAAARASAHALDTCTDAHEHAFSLARVQQPVSDFSRAVAGRKEFLRFFLQKQVQTQASRSLGQREPLPDVLQWECLEHAGQPASIARCEKIGVVWLRRH